MADKITENYSKVDCGHEVAVEPIFIWWFVYVNDT